MVKKIRFALKMDGVEVRTLTDLQEHFDIDSVMEYYLNGKLETWLDDRYYDEEANQVRELAPESSELSKKLCEIFHVEYVRDALTPEEVEARNRKIERLRKITDDEEIVDKVDSVAFTQEELFGLLEKGLDTIYLCGKGFMIPEDVPNKTYIGIQAQVVITAKAEEVFKQNQVKLIDVEKVVEAVPGGGAKALEVSAEVKAIFEKIEADLRAVAAIDYKIKIPQSFYFEIDRAVKKTQFTRDAAEGLAKVSEVYSRCQDFLGKKRYSDHSGIRYTDYIENEFRRNISPVIRKFNEALGCLDKEVKTSNQDVLDRFEKMQDIRLMEEAVKQLAKRTIESPNYEMKPCHEYHKMFWEDRTATFQELKNFIEDAANRYSKEITKGIREEIVGPLLEDMQQLVVKENAFSTIPLGENRIICRCKDLFQSRVDEDCEFWLCEDDHIQAFHKKKREVPTYSRSELYAEFQEDFREIPKSGWSSFEAMSWNGTQILYVANDGLGKLFGFMDLDGKETKIIKKIPDEVALTAKQYFFGKDYVLIKYAKGSLWKLKLDGEEENIIGKFSDVSQGSMLSVSDRKLKAYETRVGIYQVATKQNSSNKEAANSDPDFIIRELLNENNLVKTYKFKIDWKLNYIVPGMQGEVKAVYSDRYQDKLYIFWGSTSSYDRSAQIWFFDVHTKKIELATAIRIGRLDQLLGVKGDEVFYYGSFDKNAEPELMSFNMKSGHSECLWKGLGASIKGTMKGDYIYLYSNRDSWICKIKIDGSKKTIIGESLDGTYHSQLGKNIEILGVY